MKHRKQVISDIQFGNHQDPWFSCYSVYACLASGNWIQLRRPGPDRHHRRYTQKPGSSCPALLRPALCRHSISRVRTSILLRRRKGSKEPSRLPRLAYTIALGLHQVAGRADRRSHSNRIHKSQSAGDRQEHAGHPRRSTVQWLPFNVDGKLVLLADVQANSAGPCHRPKLIRT